MRTRTTLATAVAEVLAGDDDLAINVSGTDTEVIALPGTTLSEGVNTIAYAIGSPDDDTFDVLVQTIDGLHGDPSGVPAGDAGLVDDGTDGLLAVALGLLGLAALGPATRRTVRERA